MDPTRARSVLGPLIAECPWLAEDSEVDRVARAIDLPLSNGKDAASVLENVEAQVALRRLRDLAASHIPFAPALAGPEAISRFASRLDLVLRAMLDGVSSLRIAYQAETDHAAMGDELDLLDLGAFALDWSRSESHARGTLEGIFTALLAQRAELVRETAECFWRLSPSAIEATTQRSFGPLKHRALWRRYCEEYRALLGETPVGVAEAPVSGSTLQSERSPEATPMNATWPEAGVA